MAWQPTYAAIDDLKEWIGGDLSGQDVWLLYCLESASRAIDLATNRSFGQDDSPVQRFYTGEYDRHNRKWLVAIDDLMDTDGLEVHADLDGTGTYAYEITDYRLTPVNAPAESRPFTRIKVNKGAAVRPNAEEGAVRVTARFGWAAIPMPIRTACLIQASRLYERRDSPMGGLTSKQVDDVRYSWSDGSVPPAELDADVLASVAPYRRWWGAA